jgi:hypothetical protein
MSAYLARKTRARKKKFDVPDTQRKIVLAQNVDEQTTAAINYLASGFLLVLLTLPEEGALCEGV